MTALLILAAGESSRLGFPKQTLLYKGKAFIEIAIEAGLKSKCQSVTVVLGANADKIEPGIKNYPVHIVHNYSWTNGMASSIMLGVEKLKDDPSIHSIVIMLCDQPFVSNVIIDSLIYKQQETGKPIVACSYNGTLGAPSLFSRSMFDKLLTLKGQEGAKKLFQNNQKQVASIPFGKGGIDIDTLADYEALINNA